MCTGVGLDLCEISRMEKLKEDGRFLARFFTEAEGAYILGGGKAAAQRMAGIFAAKEAFGKSLGTGLAFDLREVEVAHTESGQPFYVLHGKAGEMGGGSSFLLSISHDGGIAGAVCVRETADRSVPG